MRQYELIEKVKSYQPSADEDSLIRAYVLASKVHHDQRRESGEPYFYHPTSVAQILIEYKMDADTIMAALLHDTVEDTETTLEDIEREFGKTVASYIAAESEDKRPGIPASDTWEIRKQETCFR